MRKLAFTAGLSVLLVLSSAGVMFAQNEEAFVRAASISKRDAVLLSVLFPGLGQMTAGYKVKGVALFFSGITSIAIFANAHENYTTKLETYNRDKDTLDAMALQGRANFTDASKLFQNIKGQNTKLDDLNNTRNIALYVTAGIYAYNLFDAIFLMPTSKEGVKAEKRSGFIVQSAMVDRNPGILISKSF
jgi:hypothetical protein